jgi:hypothetical protein
VTDALEAAWRACEERWDDPKAHDAFLALASAQSGYPYAAGRYKSRAGDETADRMLERLRKAALAQMMATATPRDKQRGKPYQMTAVLLIVLMVAAIAGLVYATRLPRHAAPPGEPAH